MKKKIFICMLIIITILGLFGIREANATRRAPDLNKAMKPEVVPSWRTKINGKYFDVFVDRVKKTVTIKGFVGDWDEMDSVENHFSLRAPSNYKIINKIEFENTISDESDFAD
ncbi:MAG: hypothetical protein ACMUHX_01880 [bacterium]